MPIEYYIDHERKRIIATASGALSESDLFEYQKAAWSNLSLTDYDEIFDVTQVDNIQDITSASLRQLSRYAASMDKAEKTTRLAIVASKSLFYGLARMYETFRGSINHTLKEISVFRFIEDAEQWLDMKNKSL